MAEFDHIRLCHRQEPTLNTTGLDCPAPKPSSLDGDSPMYRPRQLVDLATPITDTALMVHGFEALPQVARR